MAWERSFEKKVLKVRERELKYQKLSYMVELLFNVLWYYPLVPPKVESDGCTTGMVHQSWSLSSRSGILQLFVGRY